jgi:pectate lyase
MNFNRVKCTCTLPLLSLLIGFSLICRLVAAGPVDYVHGGEVGGWAAKTLNRVGGPSMYLDYAVSGGLHSATGERQRIVRVSDRESLQLAVAGDEPVVVIVEGALDLNQGKTAADYAAGTGYDWHSYQQAYLAGDTRLIELAEAVRAQAAKNQRQQCVVAVGSNKTLVGSGAGAIIRGGGLTVRGKNVVIRNITFEDAIDYFPRWDPQDFGGNWNADYDSIELSGAQNVWIDHCTFISRQPDGIKDSLLKNKAGKVAKVFRHDGLLDIVRGSDFVTVSYNIFANHDKTVLVGAKDYSSLDTFHLNVTFHHNWFINCLSRSPYVRYGKVHIYNNLYEGNINHAVEVGFAAQILSEANFFQNTVPAAQLAHSVSVAAAGRLADRFSLYRDSHSKRARPINLAADAIPPIDDKIGWSPAAIYEYRLDAAEAALQIVRQYAGAGKPIR